MESDRVRIVWLTLLAMCDKNGEVQASIPGLANVARVPVEDCEHAISLFMSPDPYSRTKTDEGRRIEEIDGGWYVINHEKYRGLASDREAKQKAAERQKRYRERQQRNAKNVTRDAKSVTGRHMSRHFPYTDTDTEADTEEQQSIVAIRDEAVPYREIATAFVNNFGGSLRVTKKRKSAMNARWRDDYWREHWKTALELGAARPFLLGENDRGWKMDFDFFLKPDTVDKIMEGKYASHGSGPRKLSRAEQREQANAAAFAAVFGHSESDSGALLNEESHGVHAAPAGYLGGGAGDVSSGDNQSGNLDYRAQ